MRLAFAFVGSALLMLVFGFGITLDVEHIRYAVLDMDQSPESREYLEAFATPRFFTVQQPLREREGFDARMKANEISLAIEIPPQFGRDLFERRLGPPRSRPRIDGANPFRAETIKQYTIGASSNWLASEARSHPSERPIRRRIRDRIRAFCTIRRSKAFLPSSPAFRRFCWC